MLRSVHIKNFLSFDNVKIELHPETNILIGINGSGKSNFLKALRLLKEGISGRGYKEIINSEFGGYTSIYNYTNNDTLPIEIIYEFDYRLFYKIKVNFAQNLFYKLVIKRKPSEQNFSLHEKVYLDLTDESIAGLIYLNMEEGQGYAYENTPLNEPLKTVKYNLPETQESALVIISDPDRYPVLYALRKVITDMGLYEIFDTRQNSKLRQPMLSTSASKLDKEGENLPQILNTINISQKDSYKSIKKLLHDVNSGYTDIDFNHIGPNIELMLEEENLKKSVHVTDISDGTLQFLCLLAIFKNENAGSLISIDEPEVRLHPDMINAVADSIIESSKKRQHIIATHSEYLLNSFSLENIRVFEKNENNCTEVKSFTDEQFKGWYKEFSLGQMWRKNDLGGNTW